MYQLSKLLRYFVRCLIYKIIIHFELEWREHMEISFIVEPCIDKSIISSNQLMHILLKAH